MQPKHIVFLRGFDQWRLEVGFNMVGHVRVYVRYTRTIYITFVIQDNTE